MARFGSALKSSFCGLAVFACAFAAQAQVFNVPTQFPPIVSCCPFWYAPTGSYLSLSNEFVYGPSYAAKISHVNGLFNVPFSVLPGGYGVGGHLYTDKGPIQVKFLSLQRRFGGHFMPYASNPAHRPTKVYMVFLKNNQQVGSVTVTNLSSTGWTWAGFDLGPGGFDMVAILSNSAKGNACLRMDEFYVTKS